MSTAFPRLRRDLTWRRFVMEGEDAFIFRDEIAQEYAKLDAISGTLALRLDGTISPEELLEIARATFPSLDFDEDYIDDVLTDLRELHFLEDPFERNAMLKARAKEERAQINATTFKNLFSIQIGTVNPDRFLTRAYPYVAFLFRPLSVKLGVALFIAAGWLIWLNRDHARAGVGNLLLGQGQQGLGVLLLVLTIVLATTIHELGHGFCVKHHGGKVNKIGFLLLFGMPAMFCDTSDSHMFPNRNHRVQVALAGTYVELYVAVFATLVWWLTPSHMLVNQISYNVMLIAGISGILFNYNPLIKLDGYYALADVLDMPNLQEDSYSYVGYLFRRYLLRINLESPVRGRRRKRILATYGFVSLVYSVVIGVIVFGIFRSLLIQHLAFLGALLAIVLLVVVLYRPLVPLARTARLWVLDHRGAIQRRQLPLVAAVALLAATFWLLPVPGFKILEGTLEPAREAALAAPEKMLLKDARFVAGQPVRAGEVLAVLDADPLARSADEAAARADSWRVTGAAARLQGDVLQAAVVGERAAAESRWSEVLARRVQRAELRAPFDGRVVTPAVTGFLGQCLEAGDTICIVADYRAVRARVLINELDVDDIRSGAPVRLRLRATPGEVLRGRVTAIEPAPGSRAESREFQAWIALVGVPREPRSGLTGRLRITTPARSPASHLYRWFARFVRADLWV